MIYEYNKFRFFSAMPRKGSSNGADEQSVGSWGFQHEALLEINETTLENGIGESQH